VTAGAGSYLGWGSPTPYERMECYEAWNATSNKTDLVVEYYLNANDTASSLKLVFDPPTPPNIAAVTAGAGSYFGWGSPTEYERMESYEVWNNTLSKNDLVVQYYLNDTDDTPTLTLRFDPPAPLSIAAVTAGAGSYFGWGSPTPYERIESYENETGNKTELVVEYYEYANGAEADLTIIFDPPSPVEIAAVTAGGGSYFGWGSPTEYKLIKCYTEINVSSPKGYDIIVKYYLNATDLYPNETVRLDPPTPLEIAAIVAATGSKEVWTPTPTYQFVMGYTNSTPEGEKLIVDCGITSTTVDLTVKPEGLAPLPLAVVIEVLISQERENFDEAHITTDEFTGEATLNLSQDGVLLVSEPLGDPAEMPPEALEEVLQSLLNLSVGEITIAPDPVPQGTAITATANLIYENLTATHNASWDWGDGNTRLGNVTESNGSGNVTGLHLYTSNGTFTINLTVTDTATGRSTYAVKNVTVNPSTEHSPDVGDITVSIDLVKVDTSITASATFTDPDPGDTHTASWNWGDGTTSNGSVDQANDNVTGSHKYTAAGVYTINLTVMDNASLSGSAEFQYVVVYDPTGGFITGGGWIDSAEGDYVPDPNLTGRAIFGFVARYKPRSTVPSGETIFTFHSGTWGDRWRCREHMRFRSTSYTWLVISGASAMYTGSGTIDGKGSYGFMIGVIDGDFSTIDGWTKDTFQIKIWDKQNGTVVYDNQRATDLGGGEIVIHAK
jgi:PKD repeat protein